LTCDKSWALDRHRALHAGRGLIQLYWEKPGTSSGIYPKFYGKCSNAEVATLLDSEFLSITASVILTDSNNNRKKSPTQISTTFTGILLHPTRRDASSPYLTPNIVNRNRKDQIMRDVDGDTKKPGYVLNFQTTLNKSATSTIFCTKNRQLIFKLQSYYFVKCVKKAKQLRFACGNSSSVISLENIYQKCRITSRKTKFQSNKSNRDSMTSYAYHQLRCMLWLNDKAKGYLYFITFHEAGNCKLD